MASSSSSEHHRQQRPLPLARHNSSFLGTIKNIVTAPLAWFAHQETEDDATPNGKRRRPVEQAPTEPLLPDASPVAGGREHNEVDEAARRSKRMRRDSPPRTTEHYLDPPAVALRRTTSTRRTSLVPRASSAVLPSSRKGASRATLSPLRHPQPPIQRTMSIDPPHLTTRRDLSSNASFNFGSDMDMVIDTARDDSMPPSPLSPRPSFRMRSSMTPQPHHVPARHISEPPPLNALISNPVFLHPPAQTQERAHTPTLGSLAESARATRSPARQHHSSLLFSSNASTSSNESKDAPAERALHQLDIYKTPLLPTRMRSSNLPNALTAKTTPDMFKSRRSSKLVLMSEGDRLGAKGAGRSPLVNETKPYAGEGGMKKLLARHKLDAEKEAEAKAKDSELPEEDTPRQKQASPPVASVSVPPPPPPGSDWFSTATAGASGSTSGSSLRVGRTKTSRSHFQRPPKKAGFSAVFDEELDDAMDGDEDRQKERQMLEDAAKKVPVFQMPAGFSFAKDTPAPVLPAAETEKAKEPPITSLPFSFGKPSGTPATSEPAKSDAVSKPAPTISIFAAAVAAPADPARVPTPEPKVPTAVPSFFNLQPKPAPVAPASNGGIPNFFANSQVLKETSLPAPPPVLNFGVPSSSSGPPAPATPFSFGTPQATTPAKPVKDSDNPFWVGETKPAAAEAPLNLFGTTGSTFPPLPKPVVDAPKASSPAPFSFGKPAETNSSSAPTTLPFSFGGQSSTVEVKKLESTESVAAPQPLFGAPVPNAGGLLGEPSKPASLFGEPPKATSPFPTTAAPPQSTPSPLLFPSGIPTLPVGGASGSGSLSIEAPKPFSFGAPATNAPNLEAPKPFSFGTPAVSTPPAVEPPKPLFGGDGFSFGQPAAEKEKEVKPSTPFSFGAAPSTPPTAPKPAPAFSFGQSSSPAPAAPASLGFSFSGGGSAGADVSNKQPFMFAQPPARPVTPPKHADNEFRMEESPTREMQQVNNKELESRPTIGGGAFSFGSGSSTSNATSTNLFGGAPSPASSTPFSFGGSSSSNPFASKENKPEEPKGFGGFGQSAPQAPQITTSFSFGKDDNRPSSAGGFSFGATPTSATNAAPSFSFGGPSSANPFGQSAAGSAPSSPSTFNQPFSFGGPAAAASSPFGFGSQPNSPAGGAHLTLPQPAMSTGFGGGGFGSSVSPSSPFSGPTPLAPSTSGGAPGGNLFTIGSAPAPAPGGGGPRVMKKLPRRGGVKR